MDFKLGKKAARPGAVSFRFANYANLAALPKPPRHFGHENLVVEDWQTLANDSYGDCVFAGAAHETMLWNREAGRQVPFNNDAVLSDYSAVTGFNPNDPNTDQGTDMKDAASYRRKVGVVDANGNRHKILAYIALDPGNLPQLYAACYLFGAVGMGFNFPSSAWAQFDQHKVWTATRAHTNGGHYVPVVAKRDHLLAVTWGRTQPFTAMFYERYTDEALAYVTEERLDALTGRSLEGFDRDQLLVDLNVLRW